MGRFPAGGRICLVTAHCWGHLTDDSVASSIIDEALSAADGHAEFADVRVIEAEELRLYSQLGADSDERLEHNMGIGVRVLVNGTWGFSARPLQDGHDAVNATRQALATARASVGTSAPVHLAPMPAVSGRYETAVEI